MANTPIISPSEAVKTWLFTQNADGTLSPAGFAGSAPDPTVSFTQEDFIGGRNSDGTIGNFGWRFTAIGTTPIIVGISPVAPQAGVIQLSTAAGATAGQGGSMGLDSVITPVGNLASNLVGTVGWQVQWIFKLGQTTATRFRCGLDSLQSALVGLNGLHLRYDTNASFGDTNFMFESLVGGVATSVDSTIPVDTNWHRVKITSTTAGTAIFTLYDSGGVLQSTKTLAISFNDASAFGTSLFVAIGTDATAQKSVQLDYASMYLTGLAR
jgi:hypothetical protein